MPRVSRRLHEAYEKGTHFHYIWLILIIAMLAWRDLKHSQFPMIHLDVCEAMKYALLWYTTKPMRAQDNIMFFILYHMDLHMLVSQHSRLSPTLYEKYSSVMKFKAEFHIIYIQVHMDTRKTWHSLPYLAIEDDLLTQIHQWLVEWITALETYTEDTPTKEDMTQFGEASGKDKDEKESEQEEQQGPEDPLGGDEQNIESKKTEPDPTVTEKRKAHAKAATRSKRKDKVDKTKDKTPLILTNGDLDHIGDKIQEAMTKSWNNLEDHYTSLLTSVIECIEKLKTLAQTVRQPVQVEEKLGEERQVEPTLAVQITQIPAGALQFDSTEVQQQANKWRYMNMNIAVVPLQRLHKLHQEIIDEMKQCKHLTSKLNIQVERERCLLKQKLDQVIQERDQEVQQQHKPKEVIEATCRKVLDIDVREEEPEEDKVAKLALAV